MAEIQITTAPILQNFQSVSMAIGEYGYFMELHIAHSILITHTSLERHQYVIIFGLLQANTLCSKVLPRRTLIVLFF